MYQALKIKERPESEFGPGKDPYSTFPNEARALIHQDLNITAEQRRADFLVRLEEAKLKAKPTEVSPELWEKYIKDPDFYKNDKQVVNIDMKGQEILERLDINLEILRKLQDKHYEIDIEYEMNRDLYEKQRVKDEFLEAHKEDNKVLNSYYETTYKKAKGNQSSYFLYKNPYEPKDLRFHFLVSVGTTLLTTVFLGLINPLLPLVLTYDYFLLANYAKVLNQTTFVMALDASKRHVYLNRLNFLGYHTEMKETRIPLINIRFMGEYTNKYVTLDNRGLLPSFSRIMNYGMPLFNKKTSTYDINEKIGQKDIVDTEKNLTDDQNNFKRFWRFMANSETYLIPIDHEQTDNSFLDKSIVFDLINGRQKAILRRDFSIMEEGLQKIRDDMEEAYKDYLTSKDIPFTTQREELQRKYSYYRPNREFSGNMENAKLKKVDDGTFTDNGYR
ncbi:UNKNOWN [Stylonychia lemnae]|uniref:Uncharacterized protein n=1 Tax=Stylonychia lemnae TaxID=5949 RepID=A0A078AP71_STYLE|nr:UNKNOWN [Stylonychia lemnae]|eukprot:CDW83117.1 UNKNOWN [Stylonychia lemnae]